MKYKLPTFQLLNFFKDSFGEQRTLADMREKLTQQIAARSLLDEAASRRLADSIVESFVKMRDAAAWTIGTDPPTLDQDPARWLEGELQRFARNLREVCTAEMMKNIWIALEESEMAETERDQ